MLQESSFCGLGLSLPVRFSDLFRVDGEMVDMPFMNLKALVPGRSLVTEGSLRISLFSY